MKRYLDPERYTMTPREAEAAWYRIRGEVSAGSPGRPSRTVRPAFALVTACALTAVIGGWWLTQESLDSTAPRQTVALESEMGNAKSQGTESITPELRTLPIPADGPGGDIRPPATGVEEKAAAVAKKVGTVEEKAAAEPEVMADTTPPAVPDRSADVAEPNETIVASLAHGSETAEAEAPAEVQRPGNPTAAMPRRSADSPDAFGKSRAAEPRTRMMGFAPEGARRVAPPPPVPGHPNDEPYDAMHFQHSGVNPFVATDEDALSTFALDVDTASFALARRYLSEGHLPPAASIRVEEFVNAMPAGHPAHTGEAFRLYADGGPSRFGEGHHLLRLGVVGASVEDSRRKPANLVFVIDVSGSMNRGNRLGAVRTALLGLLDQLGEGDQVGIVVYGSRGQVVLPLTDASRRATLREAILGLAPGGATNAAEGLVLAYDMARRSYEPGAINRLILCSDGVANQGPATGADGILELARRGADEGITLSTVGFGMGNYNDVLMERLADRGDGNYHYVDGTDEAERVFRRDLTGLLQTVAREAKVQVEFDPDVVRRWRLVGYENRHVADRDFRNDAVDAGEVGAGHQVTALYEIRLWDRVMRGGGLFDDETPRQLGVMRLRWESPAHDTAQAGRIHETELELGLPLVTDKAAPSPYRQLQVLAAEFAEILRDSYWARESRFADLVPPADNLAHILNGEPAALDLRTMIRQAADLTADGGR